MAEHMRATDRVGNVWHWCDTERFVILDGATGELALIPMVGKVGTREQCLEAIRAWPNGWDRYLVVRLECIAAFRVNEKAGEP